MKSIKPSAIQGWIGDLSKKLSASSVITAYHIVQGTLDLAVADDALRINPAKSPIVQVPKAIGQKVVPWTDESVFGMIDLHDEFVRSIPIIGAGCGLRQGEIFGVALEDFDFAEKTLRVRRQLKKLNSDYIFALPKNDKERIVPLPDWVAKAVQAHRVKFKPRPPDTAVGESKRKASHAQRALPLD